MLYVRVVGESAYDFILYCGYIQTVIVVERLDTADPSTGIFLMKNYFLLAFIIHLK